MILVVGLTLNHPFLSVSNIVAQAMSLFGADEHAGLVVVNM